MINNGFTASNKGRNLTSNSSEEAKWLSLILKAINSGASVDSTAINNIANGFGSSVQISTGFVELTSGGVATWSLPPNTRSISITVVDLTSGTVIIDTDSGAGVNASYKGYSTGWTIDNPQFDSNLGPVFAITVTGDAVVLVTYTFVTP